MSIRCVCPSGHVLQVAESRAGTVGLCPVCRKRVKVPQLRAEHVSEDVILDILGSYTPPDSTQVEPDEPAAVVAPTAVQQHSTARNICYKCHRELAIGMRICPHCHTYVAKLDDS